MTVRELVNIINKITELKESIKLTSKLTSVSLNPGRLQALENELDRLESLDISPMKYTDESE